MTRSLARSMGTRSTAVGMGLAPASTGVGTFIAYATQPGNVALDGTGRNSPFTSALLDNIGMRGRNLNATMIEVRKSVIAATSGRQVPWDHSALTGDFYFVPGTVPPGSQTPAPAAKTDDVEALKTRLKALEEAERLRLAAPPTARTGQGGGSASQPDAETIAQLAEARARLAVAEDQAKDLQRKLLESRRIEGQAREPAERQRLMQTSIRIQSEMSRAALAAKRLREQIAAMAITAVPAAREPMPIDIEPNRRERGFDIYEGGAIAGDKIKFGGADSIAGCLNTCRNTPGCIAGEYRPSVGAREACSVYRHVSRLLGGSDGSTAFVIPAKAAGADLPPVQPRSGQSGDASGFDLSDNVRVEGAELRSFRAASPVACRDACEQDAGCIAFQHGRKSPVMGQCQLFS
ncbi:MAG: PAN domain-containing protein, partial [Hyphomicrobium sp.]|nr:PAN domain-containing protein [Hyphomicrobium sp.]